MKKEVVLAIGVGVILLISGGLMVRRQVKNQTRVLIPTPIPTMPAPTTVAIKVQTITLTITAPTDGAVITSSKTTVIGKTVPNAEVSVNDVDTKADAKGNFSATVALDEGENSIVVFANDADGNYAEQELTVTSETF